MRLVNRRDLGLVVREARRRQGLNQHELAARIDVSRQWVANLESGRTDPRLGLVLDALDALGLRLDLVTVTTPETATSPSSAAAGSLPASLDDLFGDDDGGRGHDGQIPRSMP